MLAERIENATLVDLCAQKPNPSVYDQVIVGGSVRMGSLHVDARQYLEGTKPILLEKPLGIFLCAGFAEKADAIFANNIEAELRTHARQCACFGGEIDFSKLRGFEKLIAKMALRSAGENSAALPHLFPERIETFAALFAGETP